LGEGEEPEASGDHSGRGFSVVNAPKITFGEMRAKWAFAACWSIAPIIIAAIGSRSAAIDGPMISGYPT
jgi:hypothetical protein